MSRHGSRTLELGMALVVLNLAAWGAWALPRHPFSQTECAVLQARREDGDRGTRSGPLVEALTGSDHLLFGRPIHPLASEAVPIRALVLANALPLAASWSFVVPSPSAALGPTCSESRVCGILFLLLSSAQWAIVGGAVGRWLERRRF